MNLFTSIVNYFKRMRIPSKREVLEYYPKYLLVHKNPINKLLHILGNLLTIFFIASEGFLMMKISLWFAPFLVLTPFVVYLCAWPGHRIFEKNKPATWNTNPLLTKFCDWIMVKDLLLRNIPLDGRKERIESRK